MRTLLLLLLICTSWAASAQRYGKFILEKGKKETFVLKNAETGAVVSDKILGVDSLNYKSTFFTVEDDRYIALLKKKTLQLFHIETGQIVLECNKEEYRFDCLDEFVWQRSTIDVTYFHNPKYFVVRNCCESFLINSELQKVIYHYTWDLVFPYRSHFNENLLIYHNQKANSVIRPDGSVVLDSLVFVAEQPNGNYIFSTWYKYGLADHNGKIILPEEYSQMQFTYYDGCENLIIAKDESLKVGVLNGDGKTIIPFEYDKVDYQNLYLSHRENKCFNNLLFLYKNKSLHILDTNNRVIIDGVTKFDSYFDNNRFILVSKGELEGIVDTWTHKLTIPAVYIIDNAYGREDMIVKRHVIGATYNGLWGLLNMETGDTIAPFIYDPIAPLGNSDIRTDASWSTTAAAESDRFFVVSKNNLWGILDYNGKEIVPFEYQMIEHNNYFFREAGVILVKKNGLYGLLDLQTLAIKTPCEYIQITDRLRATKMVNGEMVDTFLEFSK
jgi:hypothetical protein